MPNYSYGSTWKDRVLRFIEALINYANQEIEGDLPKDLTDLEISWKGNSDSESKLMVKTELSILEKLSQKVHGDKSLTREIIRQILNHYLVEVVPIIKDHRSKPHGSSTWHFTLILWSKEAKTNLEEIKERWGKRHREENQVLQTPVQEVREKVRENINVRCGMMRVLDMEQPIGLGDIYTKVNILEKITGRQRLEIKGLLQGCASEDFDRFQLGGIRQKRVSGLDVVEQHSKLMIFGKPGAGKTTFLKRLAISCIDNKDEFQKDQVPIFIALKEFAEAKGQPELPTYITQQWEENCGILDIDIANTVLNQGRALVLLDGLDEVRKTDHSRVIGEIQRFTNRFSGCQFVITCRIAAQDYTFEQFTEVEVADFEDKQIKEFVGKWFAAKQDPVKAKTFIQKLEANKPVKELATNPLLLTLLCLVFSDLYDFPRSRSELYKEGLDVLLKKWDAKRNIERDQVYRNLSLRGKQDLLSQIAFETFDKSEYFFKQRAIEKKIEAYLDNLKDANTKPDARQKDSEAVLKAIEAHHGLLVERARGIYSFSHLTFQEYFTANQIVNSPASQALKALESLSSHITEKRWREVFLLAVEMLRPADDLLKAMKAEVDKILAGDKQLQKFLAWVQAKSESVEASYKPAAIRAFYFSLVSALALASARALDLTLALALARARALDLALASARALDLDLDLDLALDRALALASASDRASDLTSASDRASDLALALALALACARDRARASKTDNNELEQDISILRDELPDRECDLTTRKEWWKSNGNTWLERLSQVMIKHRNIGHDWQFSDEQSQKLQQYHDANKFLVECLNSDCYVTREVREEIENTLLLPMAEIEKRKKTKRE